jgi:hypothetical protein
MRRLGGTCVLFKVKWGLIKYVRALVNYDYRRLLSIRKVISHRSYRVRPRCLWYCFLP